MEQQTGTTTNNSPRPASFPADHSLFHQNYAPALESTACAPIAEQYELFINGEFVKPQSGQYFATVNPSTGQPLAKVAHGNSEDVDTAVKAARKAYTEVWSQLTGAERGRYLFRIARVIQERARELAVLETMDNGKPIKESRDIDIPLVAAHFFYNAGWADKLEYLYPGKMVSPVGVAAQVIPWNFPLLMAAWKIAPALATGNCVVLKPAETTPLTALRLGEILQEVGLPPGVVNIVTGFGDTGDFLVRHKDVNKVAFTGSTEIGKTICRNVAGTNKRLTMELGGKSAHIVFADAAMDQAIEGVIQGIFFNQGHVCCAGSRLLLQESIADTFVEKLKQRMETLRVGNPLDKNTDVGAINSKTEYDKINKLIELGKNEGGEFFAPSCELPQDGYFIKPCFFNNVASSSTLSRLEVFGPVLTVSTFRTVNEAISKANDTSYGLAAGIWSNKGAKIYQVASQLKAGVIWSNTYNKFDPTSPFGGYFESGFGREGGRQGLMPYVEVH